MNVLTTHSRITRSRITRALTTRSLITSCSVFIFFACCLAWPAWSQDRPNPNQTDTPSVDNRASGSTNVQGYEQTFPSMGTLITIQAFSHDAELIKASFAKAESEIERLVAMMSDYDTDSELSRLNATAGTDQWVQVSPELWEVLEISDHWHRISQGGFDPSIGALTRLWRKARRQRSIPSANEVSSALARCGWQYVERDAAKRAVRLNRKEMYLDLGAIAKGYIVDKAFMILKADGLPQAMVNAGGNLRCGEAPPDSLGWRIEISSLGPNEPPIRRIMLENCAVSTSGDLWQFSVIDGKRRSHIIDPRTGWGLEGPVAVTVCSPTACEADAASTALSVIGQRAGATLAESLPELEALFLSRIAATENLDEVTIDYCATSGFYRGHFALPESK